MEHSANSPLSPSDPTGMAVLAAVADTVSAPQPLPINRELSLLEFNRRVLALAREAFPGKRNNLDALCERFGVSNAHRTLHGALLDAQLLAEVYLAMTRGQESLTIDMGAGPLPAAALDADASTAPRPLLAVTVPSPDELLAHQAYLEVLDRETKGRCLWLTATPPPLRVDR